MKSVIKSLDYSGCWSDSSSVQLDSTGNWCYPNESTSGGTYYTTDRTDGPTLMRTTDFVVPSQPIMVEATYVQELEKRIDTMEQDFNAQIDELVKYINELKEEIKK